MKQAEDLIGIDGTQGKIVIGVTAIVEVETSEHFFTLQPCQDLFDILCLIVMAGIDQNESLWAGGAREQQRHAPVGDVCMVEGGLKWLVLDQHALPGCQRCVGSG